MAADARTDRSLSAATWVAIPTCPMCDWAAHEVLHAGSHPALVRCSRCHLVRATARLDRRSLDAYYRARANRPSVASHSRVDAAFALYDRLADGRLSRPSENARALDIGCNTGAFLDVLAKHGWGTHGVEHSGAQSLAAARHVVHRLDVDVGLDAAMTAHGPFALVSLLHVLEHLRRPVEVLEQAARQLTPDGLLLLEVPNWGDVGRFVWGTHYRPLELGDHISFFDRETLTTAAERAGLQVRVLWSAPRASTLLLPSMLTAGDRLAALTPRLARQRSRQRDRASASHASQLEQHEWHDHGNGHDDAKTGVDGPRIDATQVPARFREAVLAGFRGLEKLDPLIEQIAGATAAWGANLVMLATRRPLSRDENPVSTPFTKP